jgi:hypothetical protein
MKEEKDEEATEEATEEEKEEEAMAPDSHQNQSK